MIHYIIHYTRGEIDTTQFEDECRTVLGNNAYFLFTIDKLCNNIIKYLHGFMSDTTFDQIKVCYMDSHINQQALYDYHQEDQNNLEVYRNNIICTLKDVRTDLFRVEFKPTKSLGFWYVGKEVDLFHNPQMKV